jgi:Peroxidase, family 2
MSALHMDKPLASALTNSLKPLVHKDQTFSLADMRQHNIIEHDASFTRLDFRQGDNYTLQPPLLQALLADADGGPVTVKSLAKTYVRRRKESKAAGSPSLPINLWFVNLLQSVSFLNTAATGGKLSRELMLTFYTEERFPEEILRNEKPRTLFGLVGNAFVLLFYTFFEGAGWPFKFTHQVMGLQDAKVE